MSHARWIPEQKIRIYLASFNRRFPEEARKTAEQLHSARAVRWAAVGTVGIGFTDVT
jgi:hypothetical protein